MRHKFKQVQPKTRLSNFIARYLSAASEVAVKHHRPRMELRVNHIDLVQPAMERLQDEQLLSFLLRHGCLTVARSRDVGTFVLAQILTVQCFFQAFDPDNEIKFLPLTFAYHLLFTIINRPIYHSNEKAMANAIYLKQIIASRGYAAPTFFIPASGKGIKLLGSFNRSDESQPGCFTGVESKLRKSWETFGLKIPETAQTKSQNTTLKKQRVERAGGLAKERQRKRSGALFDAVDLSDQKRRRLSKHKRPFENREVLYVGNTCLVQYC